LSRLAELEARLPPEDTPPVSAFIDLLKRFLETYGYRTGKGFGSESTVLTPTWREDPSLVLRLAAPYLDPGVEPPAAARQRVQNERDARVEEICQSSSDATLVAEFLRWLPNARRDEPILEDHNHYIDQMSSGQLRAAIVAAGLWLAARGDLANSDDIFWLQSGEVIEALRSSKPGSFSDLVAVRKELHVKWVGMEAPPLLGVPDAHLEARQPLEPEMIADEPQEANCITGQGASPGLHRGRARVISASVILPDLEPGDVLVAENAGPMWTPFFPILGGLVLDKGALLQHAASTAREYGVPAVIATRNATRRIPDGAWVVVDGTRGIVEIVEKK
jgi:pyruvate,water dikinase